MPLTCDECAIEKGWPCAYLDPDYDAQHHEERARVCAVDKAHAAGLVLAMVPADDASGGADSREARGHGRNVVPVGRARMRWRSLGGVGQYYVITMATMLCGAAAVLIFMVTR